LKAERWVCCDDGVLAESAGLGEEFRFAERIAADDLEVGEAVKVEIHFGHGGSRQVVLLAVEAKGAGVTTGFVDGVDGFDEDSGGSAGGVTDRIAWLRVEDTHE
jgi:hypothetical protein